MRTGDREALFGLLPLYILHRASIEPVFSSAIVEQLRRHGLQLSVRSISQVLAGLRRKGYLAPASVPTESHSQKVISGHSPRLHCDQARHEEPQGTLF